MLVLCTVHNVAVLVSRSIHDLAVLVLLTDLVVGVLRCGRLAEAPVGIYSIHDVAVLVLCTVQNVTLLVSRSIHDRARPEVTLCR